MKKFFAVLLSLVLVLSMGTVAFAADVTTEAADTTTGTITISNAVKGYEYTVYKMLVFEPTEGSADKGIYTIAEGWADFFAGETAKKYFDVTGDKVVIKTGVTVDAELARAAVDYGKNASTGISESKTADADSVEFTGLGLG